MPDYRKGTTPEGLLRKFREDFPALCAAIQAHPDAGEAWRYAVQLGDLLRDLEADSLGFKGWLLLYLQNLHGMTHQQLSDMTRAVAPPGISRPRVGQIIEAARKRGGNPVSDATSVPIPKPIVLAVITSRRGVLVGRRIDGVPPVTFIGGEAEPGESRHDVAARRVLAETGLIVTGSDFIGDRIHPRTGKWVHYVHAQVDGTDAILTEEGARDLSVVEWINVAATRTLMPDMFGPVRAYLDALETAISI